MLGLKGMGRGKGSKSLGGRWACSSTQHQEIAFIQQWRKSMEAPSDFLQGASPAPVPPQKSEFIIDIVAVLCAATQFCTAAMDTSSSKKDSLILGNLVRIKSSLLVYKNFRVSKVSELLRALRLQKIFAEEKAKPMDLKMSPLYLNKCLLNISVGFFPFLIRLVPYFNSLFNCLQTLRLHSVFCCLGGFSYHHVVKCVGSVLSNRSKCW